MMKVMREALEISEPSYSETVLWFSKMVMFLMITMYILEKTCEEIAIRMDGT